MGNGFHRGHAQLPVSIFEVILEPVDEVSLRAHDIERSTKRRKGRKRRRAI